MKQICAIHGEVEFLAPDQNLNSYCSLCWKESCEKWCKRNSLPRVEDELSDLEKEIGVGKFTRVSMGATVEKPTCPICSGLDYEEAIHVTVSFPQKVNKG